MPAKKYGTKNPTYGLNNLMAEIGLVYVKGSLPRFEEFGNLPTCTSWRTGWKMKGQHLKVVDLILLPGGSMIESKSITARLQKDN